MADEISFEWDDVQTVKDIVKEYEVNLTIAAVSRIKAERKHEALKCTCAVNHEAAKNKAAKDK
jgi:hypothetical protein